MKPDQPSTHGGPPVTQVFIKECLNFMDGWLTSEAAMSGVLKPTDAPLGSLFLGDPDTMLDTMLNDFSTYNCKS